MFLEPKHRNLEGFCFYLVSLLPGTKSTDQLVVTKEPSKKKAYWRHKGHRLISQINYSITALSNYFIHYSNHKMSLKTLNSHKVPNVTPVYQIHQYVYSAFGLCMVLKRHS